MKRGLARRMLLAAFGALLLGFLLLVATPTGRYLIRGAYAELGILAGRRSISAMIADSSTSASVRQRLAFVLEARAFAVSQLGLEARQSFTTYSPVAHDTLVLVLTAAYRDRLEPVRWWFPIVGRVPYKGYFDFAAAARARDDLEQKGYDTVLGASGAFSTLGWFNDPLLSTTLRRDTLELAETVIHELLHNTVFLKGQVEFDESFASFVGAHGAARFFRSRGSERAARAEELRWEDDKRLSLFWRTLSRTLDSAYAQWLTDSAARVLARDTVYARARRVLADSIAPVLRTYDSRALARMPLNNAVLIARRAYAHDLDLFDEMLRRSGGDLRRTIQQIRAATEGTDDAFDALRHALAAGATATVAPGGSVTPRRR